MTLRSFKSSLVVTILLSPTFDCSVNKSYAKTVSLRQPVQIIVKIDHVGEQMLGGLVRAISLLGFAVAIAKLSPRSLIIKSCMVQHYLWTYWGI